MDAVWIDVPEEFLEERRRNGQDKKDELWEGVLHMVPPSSPRHNRVSFDLYIALRAIAARPVFYGPVSGRRTPREADGVFSPGGVTVGTEVRAAGDFDVNGLVDVLSFEPTLQRSAGIDRVWITYAAGP